MPLFCHEKHETARNSSIWHAYVLKADWCQVSVDSYQMLMLRIRDKQANKNFGVFKKPVFSEKSGFSENFMPENLWNLT